ncbi:MAG: hypothetical protein H6604_00590 [Flavobacteriales bacterium]|nr:hypothetical protein [Flavobacteriales bacterium]
MKTSILLLFVLSFFCINSVNAQSVEEKINQKETEVKELKDLESNIKKFNKYEDKISDEENAHKKLEENLASKKGELEKVTKTYEEKKAKYDDAKQELDKAKSELSDVESDIKSIERDIEKSLKKNSKYFDKKAELEDQIKTTKEKYQLNG